MSSYFYLEFLLLYNISQYLSCVNFSKGNAIVKPKPVVDIDEGTTVTEEERRKVIIVYLKTTNAESYQINIIDHLTIESFL